jgi:hypothetical protein
MVARSAILVVAHTYRDHGPDGPDCPALVDRVHGAVEAAADHERPHRSVPLPLGQAIVVIRLVRGRLVVVGGHDLLGEDVEAFVSLAAW